MLSKTSSFLEIWKEERSRFLSQLEIITESDLAKKVSPTSNSVGFLIRHIGDVELLFTKNVFGVKDLKVKAKTVMRPFDTGEWTDLAALKEYVNYSGMQLETVLNQQQDEDWESIIETKEFGSKTKSQALGRISSHTAYHAGQIAMVMKYGSSL